MAVLRLFRDLWRKTGLTGMKYRIIGIVIFLMLLMGSGITFQAVNTLREQSINHLEERALYIARELSARYGIIVPAGQVSILAAEVEKTVRDNPDISYVVIKNKKGMEILKYTAGAIVPEPASSPSETIYQYGGYKFRDSGTVNVVLPMSEEQGGLVWVGMSEKRVNNEVWSAIRHLTVGAGAFFLFGLLAALVFTHLLLKPVRDLAKTARSAASGDLNIRATVGMEDDVGKLGKAFNLIMIDLQKAVREKQNLWNEVKKREENKGQLLEKIIGAQEEERRRIARELHDETSQSMASLMVGLKMLEQEGNGRERKHKIKELRDLASATMDKVRSLALELRPSSLDDLGLLTAVEQYTRDLEKQFGLKIDFQAVGGDIRRLSPEKETALYRIIQEALINVAQHSKATTAGVIIEVKDKVVIAIVEDNGCGFETDEATESGTGGKALGIIGMSERASLMGGKLTIESVKGQGTTVFAEIPL